MFAGVAVIMFWFLTIPRVITITVQASVSRSVRDIVVEAAIRNDIDVKKFLATAQCESSLRPGVTGDGGNSIGLFQIHLPSHPQVTKEEAFDAYWSAEWSAKKFKINPNIWTCYRNIYGLKK